MFNNEMMADVHFVVGPPGGTQRVPGHKVTQTLDSLRAQKILLVFRRLLSTYNQLAPQAGLSTLMLSAESLQTLGHHRRLNKDICGHMILVKDSADF